MLFIGIYIVEMTMYRSGWILVELRAIDDVCGGKNSELGVKRLNL